MTETGRMTALIPPQIYEVITEERAGTAASLKAMLGKLMPGLSEKKRAWADARCEEFIALNDKFLRNPDVQALRPEMRRLCKMTAASGISSESFIRIVFDAQSKAKSRLVELMACEAEELARIYRKIDEYDQALVDEFARAQTEYWLRREREAAKRHSDFFENIPFPAITGTPDLVIERLNQALIDCIPIHPEQMIGLKVDEWLLRMSVSPRRVALIMTRFHERGELVSEEIRLMGRRERSEFPMVLVLTMKYVHDLEGRKTGFQAMVQDVTEKRALEYQLKGQMAQMEAIFQSTPAGILFVDSGLIVRRINESACRLLGYGSREEAEGESAENLARRAPENFKDPQSLKNLFGEVRLNAEISKIGTIETVDPQRNLRYRIATVHDQGGAAIGWLWVFWDITDQIAAQRLRNDLTHMIVHDLKNPLTSIKGGTRILQDLVGDKTPQLEQAFGLIRRNSDRMVDMIMNLLDIERLESGRLELQRATFALDEFLRAAADIQRPSAGDRSLTVQIDPRLAGRALWADLALIERVVGNLLSNAIKNTRPDGEVTLRASWTPEEAVRIEVADNGSGIPAQYHEKIFEKFGQAELRKEGRRTDTGLGLTFCKLAVEAHGGRISVQSASGEGSTFAFTLPCETPAAAPAPAEEHESASPAASGR